MTLSFLLKVLEGGALRSNYGLTGQILLKVSSIAKPFRWKIPLILFMLQKLNLCNLFQSADMQYESPRKQDHRNVKL